MAKKVIATIKLQIPGGQATPAPPIGPVLSQHGVNLMQFCKRFNAETEKDKGVIIPVVITVYVDKSFTFITKTPPASYLIKKAAGLEKGSGVPNKEKVGKIKREDIKKIAELKMKDLNAKDIEGAIKMIEGTARSMGILVED